MNLSDFAAKGAHCEVNEEVKRALEESYKQGIVIGAMCIAPVVIARVLGKHSIKVTIGHEPSVADGIRQMGAVHEEAGATDVCVDKENKIVTTPCYMLAKSIKEIARGTQNLVDAMVELM